MAEAILRHLAQARLRVASAGQSPEFSVSPHALECLSAHGVSTAGLRSKGWGEYFGLGRPEVRFLITLSDVYAACAAWPPRTLIARWPTSDPARIAGSLYEVQHEFELVFVTLQMRVQRLLSLQLEHLDDAALTRELALIGECVP